MKEHNYTKNLKYDLFPIQEMSITTIEKRDFVVRFR
jgi:hypothetical protein